MLAKTPLLLAVFMLNFSLGDFYYLMCPLHSVRENYCNCGQSLYVPMIQSRSVYGSQLSTEILPEPLWVVPADDYKAEIPAMKIAVLPSQLSSEGKVTDLQTSTNHIVQPKLMPDVKVSWKLEKNNPESRESALDTPGEKKSGKMSGDSNFDGKEKSQTNTEKSVMNLTEADEQSTSMVLFETTERMHNTIEKLNEHDKTKKLIIKEKVENTEKRRKVDPNED
ncbi:uncharacterized protein [Euwallacea fornicatus]|uniref:uncharacterized protein n=1 Tax=Euwallacea fornicatus TaxID=995702 RepID=UPI00338EB788